MADTSNQRALAALGALLERETGIALGGLREDLVVARLTRRMRHVGARNLAEYAALLEKGQVGELQEYINLMTTNHTYFFREQPHLDFIASVFVPRFLESSDDTLNVWCAACSTGEEVYTVAMILMRVLSRLHARVKLSVWGTDINTEALRIATNAVYPGRRLENVPANIRRDCLRRGKFPHDGYYQVAPEVRKIVRFSPGNLIRPVEMFQTFDLVLCRNVLIYFERATMRKVVGFLRSRLKPTGVFITGLSEQVDNLDPQLALLGRSIHVLHGHQRYVHSSWDTRPLVEVLGDSAVGVDTGAQATMTAEGNQRASSRAQSSPTQQQSRAAVARPVPKSLRTATSLRPVPAANGGEGQSVADAEPPQGSSVASHIRSPRAARHPSVLVAIGSSTGGQQAISDVLRDLPRNFPPVVVAQHIAKGYSAGFARCLDRVTSLTVCEAAQGDSLEPGRVYVAPGGAHLEVVRRAGRLQCVITYERRSQAFLPSVDLLFESLAELTNVTTFAAVLTGMGKDGTRGALALAAQGHWIVAQDTATSLVSGMPDSVAAAGAATIRLPISAIGASLASRIRTHYATRADAA